jgi:putative pyruvate formate lyase activating enzyme
MEWIASELCAETYVNLMAQYHPVCRVTATEYPEINRRITRSEFQETVDAFYAAGLFRLDSDSVDFVWHV